MHCKLNHKIGSVISMCACMAWMTLACQEDRYLVEPSADNINFQITNDRETASRSGSDVSLDIDGQELSLVWSIEENTDSLQVNGSADSRGAAFDNNTHLIPSIYTTAIYPEGNGGKFYFKDEQVNITNQKGTSGHFWPDGSLSFFAYASTGNQNIAPTFQRSNGECSGSFSYTLPGASTSGNPKDATAQPDIVFAIAPDQTKDDAPVELVFHHALSAIVFKVGNMPSNIQLESIAISKVYASGSCKMNEATSQILFEWICNGNQTYTYTESLGSISPVKGEQMGGAEATFMMLPQTMSEDTKLVFTFSVGGKKYVKEKSFQDINITVWKADHKYTFTIGLPDDIDVEVTDNVENGLIKKDVKIQNTGIVTGYIRAAIVGYWKNNAGVIEAPWSPESDGTFGDFNSTEWKKGTDGFYYHLNPVGGNLYTAPLFDTYTLKNEVAEKNKGLTLEISIVAQIIPEDQKNLWSELNDSSN